MKRRGTQQERRRAVGRERAHEREHRVAVALRRCRQRARRMSEPSSSLSAISGFGQAVEACAFCTSAAATASIVGGIGGRGRRARRGSGGSSPSTPSTRPASRSALATLDARRGHGDARAGRRPPGGTPPSRRRTRPAAGRWARARGTGPDRREPPARATRERRQPPPWLRAGVSTRIQVAAGRRVTRQSGEQGRAHVRPERAQSPQSKSWHCCWSSQTSSDWPTIAGSNSEVSSAG